MTEIVGNSLLGRWGGFGAHGPLSFSSFDAAAEVAINDAPQQDADGVEEEAAAEVAMMLQRPNILTQPLLM